MEKVQIIVHFQAPDSLAAKYEVKCEAGNQQVSYLAVVAQWLDRILEAFKRGPYPLEELRDSTLTDSCIILDIPGVDRDIARLRWNNLAYPHEQIALVAKLFESQVFLHWVGTPIIQAVVQNVVTNVAMLLKKAEAEKDQDTLELPGGVKIKLQNLGFGAGIGKG